MAMCSDEELAQRARQWSIRDQDLIGDVSCTEPYEWQDPTEQEWEFSPDVMGSNGTKPYHVCPLPALSPHVSNKLLVSFQPHNVQERLLTHNVHQRSCAGSEDFNAVLLHALLAQSNNAMIHSGKVARDSSSSRIPALCACGPSYWQLPK